MIETALSFVIGTFIGLSGTWVIRKQRAYDRAVLVLVLYLPLNGLSIILGVSCGWFGIGRLTESAFFSGMLGWIGCLLGMLANMCSMPPPKPTPNIKTSSRQTEL